MNATLLVGLLAANAIPPTPPPASPDALTGGPIISPPASVAATGYTNTSPEGFDEEQGVVLSAGVEVDPGGAFIPSGTTVDSHMILLNTGGPAAGGTPVAFCFDGIVIGVMSDEDGVFEAASNGELGLPPATTTYPGSFRYRGLELSLGDGYTVRTNTIEVTMNVTSPGDWIRVVTDPGTYEGPTFSLTQASPTVGVADPWTADAIGAGDILTVGEAGFRVLNPLVAAGTAVRPGVLVDETGLLGLGAVGADIDALSFGSDDGSTFVFSVNEGAIGCAPAIPATVCLQPSGVYLEGYCPCAPVGPVCMGAPSTCQAAGDVFEALAGGGNALLHDEAQFGLVDAAAAAPPVDDDIDALDLDTTSSDLVDVNARIYFSLDAATAAAYGFSGADILVIDACSTAGPRVYASAQRLALLPLLDDVDALALYDDGDGIFEPAVDKIYFSLRAGSATLGNLDCATGQGISEGDILTTRYQGGCVPAFPALCPAGSPCNPAIAVRHSDLGLFVNPPDDLDALDLVDLAMECYADCDESGELDFFDFLCFQNAFAAGCP